MSGTNVDNATLQGAELRISNFIHEGDEILVVRMFSYGLPITDRAEIGCIE